MVVYDLSYDKIEPICEQQLVTKSKLTHLCFNPHFTGKPVNEAAATADAPPIMIVSDSRGSVSCLKLSPNLRKTKRPGSDEDQTDRITQIVNNLLGKRTDAPLLQ